MTKENSKPKSSKNKIITVISIIIILGIIVVLSISEETLKTTFLTFSRKIPKIKVPTSSLLHIFLFI